MIRWWRTGGGWFFNWRIAHFDSFFFDSRTHVEDYLKEITAGSARRIALFGVGSRRAIDVTEDARNGNFKGIKSFRIRSSTKALTAFCYLCFYRSTHNKQANQPKTNKPLKTRQDKTRQDKQPRTDGPEAMRGTQNDESVGRLISECVGRKG